MNGKNNDITYEDIINLALRRSFFFPASEIYDNYPAGFFDFGPYGASLKRKIVEVWRKELVKKEEFFEIDGAIVMPEDVFNSSGHLKAFKDPITNCKKCNSSYRADKILEEKVSGGVFKEAMSEEELTSALRKYKIVCPHCKGELSDVEKASLMVRTIVGVSKNKPTYLRPESCQSIFIDFLRMCKTMRAKLPFGISQYGKVFRNEISPRQTLLRTVEFTQMETEIFFDPQNINEIENFSEIEDYEIMVQRSGEDTPRGIKAKDIVTKKIVSGKLIAYYLAKTQQLYEKYGFKKENIRFRELDSEERAFYAKEAFDFEVKTRLGWVELIANNYRTDYDIKGHMNGSKKDLRYVYENGKKIIPHVWEISIGTDRTLYAVIDNSAKVGKEGIYLALPKTIAPIEVAVFPLLSNKQELVQKAEEVYSLLKNNFDVFIDISGSIGKRYARQDEIGTPYCLTIDFDSLKNNDITIRERDTTEQKRIKINKLTETLA
ncbi:MAG: glycine--tRNA ligase, partial [Candidatus Woesearchaeota archaeon]